MKKLKSDGNILDPLSELPDSLIHQILSLLEIRDVVKTTLLSKRWKDFWVTTPCLRFRVCGRDLVMDRNFVYRTLTLWRGTHLREFSILVYCHSKTAASLFTDMAMWVHFATERKVEDLSIQIYSDALFCPPQCLYECSLLRKLSLSGCNLQIRGNVKWDRLSTLKLSGRVFSEDVSSLAEVNLDFNPVLVREALCQILPVIQHVVTVELSASCFRVLGAFRESYSFPPLLNVKLLTIDSWLIKLSDIVGLFECFPKLKKLVIHCKSVSEQFRIHCKSVIEQFKFDAENYAKSEASILKSNLLQLLTVVITTRYVYEASFFEFTGFLLKHGSMIEKMVIRREGVVSSEEMFEAAKKLMSL